MSILSGRIHREDYLAAPAYHPVGTVATVTTWPGSSVTYADGKVLYGTLHPLYTADGAVVPAAADVTYPGAVPAGRP